MSPVRDSENSTYIPSSSWHMKKSPRDIRFLSSKISQKIGTIERQNSSINEIEEYVQQTLMQGKRNASVVSVKKELKKKRNQLESFTTVQAASVVGYDISQLQSQRDSWQRRPEDYDDFKLKKRGDARKG